MPVTCKLGLPDFNGGLSFTVITNAPICPASWGAEIAMKICNKLMSLFSVDWFFLLLVSPKKLVTLIDLFEEIDLNTIIFEHALISYFKKWCGFDN